ncbi:Sec-independent protein translocase protein TatB [Roseinatronobacter alkalisoli]|uniref:Sec-independent protein translocase protein TatB n=1 Tax=Roseinatronobacter alkalisoli TaxID=3028235 RepID=A0ABT5TAL5_9RHOB|nr:Sec-independent protein translocase protein TatB [Roseinatronobacter sp. HJB301]MDD7971237.1 Sec-independent protein translocase protein TatB [Roseinatronobacter sp. HJB301]
MLDIGWTELLVIGVVALIVVGPKDLPKMFRTLGQFTAKARNMAREFQRAMDEAADETGVKDVARDLRGMTDPQKMGLDELNKMKNWDPLKSDTPAKRKTRDSDAGDNLEELDDIAAGMEQAPSDHAPETGAATTRPAKDSSAESPKDDPASKA